MPIHPLARLGWRADLQSHLDALGDPSLVPARIVAADRGRAVVDDGSAAWSAPLAGRLRRGRAAPATGDFAAVLPGGPVRAILPRRGVVARRGDGGRAEVLAANVDLALLATSPNRDLNPRRLARFLAITARGDVRAVVLLTKADLAPDPAAAAAALQDGLDGTPVVPVSALLGTGVDAVRALLAPGRTAVLLGSSGVGKSTMVNALVPGAGRATGGVNAVTGRGRHTSSSAIALELPAGGWVIDTPGVRSFGLAHIDLTRVIRSFPDLEPGTEDCPRSCSHDEPECALDDWVATGHSDPARLASLRRLLRSRDQDEDGASE